MPQLVPSIATPQQAYDYMGLSAAQAAALLPNGTTSVATFVGNLLDRAATAIVGELGVDFTTSQVEIVKFYGNGLSYISIPYPVGSITSFKSFDPGTNLVVDEGVGNVGPISIDPYVLSRSDGRQFDSWKEYVIFVALAPQPLYPAPGWPTAIIQVQLEMVAIWFRESANQSASLGKRDFPAPEGGRPLQYLEKLMNWKARLRPFKRLAA